MRLKEIACKLGDLLYSKTTRKGGKGRGIDCKLGDLIERLLEMEGKRGREKKDIVSQTSPILHHMLVRVTERKREGGGGREGGSYIKKFSVHW